MKEEWRPLFDVYEISNLGVVRRRKTVRRYRAGLVIATRIRTKSSGKSCGYEDLRLHKDGSHRSYFVHVLVAEAFLGKKPKGMCVNHIDGNKANNKVDNLEYVTLSDNVQKAMINGQFKKRRLSYELADEIRKQCTNSEAIKIAAKKFSVRTVYIHRILRGEIWQMPQHLSGRLLPCQSRQ